MRYQTRVRRFAKEARARMLKNEYEKAEIKTPSNRVFKMAKNPQDERLYELVCKMALSNEIITNPIARMMDETSFSAMGTKEKTKYVFELSNKYVSLLQRMRNEENAPNIVYASVLN